MTPLGTLLVLATVLLLAAGLTWLLCPKYEIKDDDDDF